MGGGIRFGSSLAPYSSIKHLVQILKKRRILSDGEYFKSDDHVYKIDLSASTVTCYLISDASIKSIDRRIIIKSISINNIKRAVTEIMLKSIHDF